MTDIHKLILMFNINCQINGSVCRLEQRTLMTLITLIEEPDNAFKTVKEEQLKSNEREKKLAFWRNVTTAIQLTEKANSQV